MKRTSLFLVILIALLKFTQAQPSLRILNDSVSIVPDTVLYNQHVTISFAVINTGNQNFNGPLVIYYSVNNNYQNVLDSFNTNIPIDTGGQQYIVVDTTHTITSPLFEVGDNIVVIWPAALNGDPLTGDSSFTNIYVIDTSSGIGSPDIKEQIRVFYRNTDLALFVSYGNLVSQIKDVTMYSVLGKQIARYNYAVNEISFAENSPQIFLLVIRTKQGESISFKILRM